MPQGRRNTMELLNINVLMIVATTLTLATILGHMLFKNNSKMIFKTLKNDLDNI
ncbi:MAG: hypothetical protein ACI9TY_000284 [Alphaproteobacteria bacterium]|jgi:hypothetical protein